MLPPRPLKLEDCRLHGPGSGAELFIVEGDSASMSVAAARQSRFQAVLPMQGKPMNTLRASEARVAANPWFAALVQAMGAGWGPGFDPAVLRYERVLLLMDPDADGIHCGALLSMFFYRWMRPLLDAGCLWLVRAPVGELRLAAPEPAVLAYTPPQFQALAERARGLGEGQSTLVRYRGLAGLERGTLQHTCLDPATRVAHAMQVRDAEMAIEVFGGDAAGVFRQRGDNGEPSL